MRTKARIGKEADLRYRKYRVELCRHEKTVYEVEADTDQDAIEKARQGKGRYLFSDNTEFCSEVAMPVESEGGNHGNTKA
ncbi:hypothetical protein LCGC14_0529310 [marine sediment metagenome]|uniref:Uncharacterized protein n=1 Tax=marine sediment metagenome TaxID=412755 RepID=A0A0F9SEI8_9ZZZZ